MEPIRPTTPARPKRRHAAQRARSITGAVSVGAFLVTGGYLAIAEHHASTKTTTATASTSSGSVSSGTVSSGTPASTSATTAATSSSDNSSSSSAATPATPSVSANTTSRGS